MILQIYYWEYFGEPFVIVKYSDIAIVDIKRSANRNFNAYYIYIVDKNFKKIKVANGIYLSEERSLMLIEEIKKKAPNVLVGYNKENMYRAKLMMNN